MNKTNIGEFVVCLKSGIQGKLIYHEIQGTLDQYTYQEVDNVYTIKDSKGNKHISNKVSHVQGAWSPQWKELMSYVAYSIGHIGLDRLTCEALADYVEKFHDCPGSDGSHHWEKLGLLKHTLGTIKNADRFSKEYTFLNRMGMIFGATFHDIGKTLDYTWNSQQEDYVPTDHGKLVGHCGGAVEILAPYFDKYCINKDLREYLYQVVGSHMGNEMASLSKMCTPETIYLNFADHMDALADAVQKAKILYEQGWSKEIIGVANTYLYFY